MISCDLTCSSIPILYLFKQPMLNQLHTWESRPRPSERLTGFLISLICAFSCPLFFLLSQFLKCICRSSAEATIEDAQVCLLSSFIHWSVSPAVYKRVLQTAGINSGKRTLHTSSHITMCLKWPVVLSNVLNSSICVCLTKISQIFTIQFVVNINNVLSFWRSACFG